MYIYIYTKCNIFFEHLQLQHPIAVSEFESSPVRFVRELNSKVLLTW